MARELNHLDLGQNEIRNARVHVLAGAPSTPVEGQIYYDSTTKRFMFRTDAAWIDPAARANHTGTQPASSISDFDTQVRTSRLDQMAAPSAAVSMNNQRLTNLATPTSAADGATKAYVDGLVNGTDWKTSARMASTGNLTLSGLQTIDDITGADGNRVLAKNQTDPAENGIWLMRSGAWERAPDATNGNLSANAAIFIEEGTVNQDTQWRITTNDPIVVGTTGITWTQMGAGSSYTAGNGINIAGASISVDPAVVVRKYAATIGDGSSTSITVTHNLNTKDITWSLRYVSDDAHVRADCVSLSTSQATFLFASAPANASLRLTIQG